MNISGVKYTFQCAESAFQAHKFVGYPDLIKQFEKVDGDKAFRLARANNHLKRGDWISGKMNVTTMEKVLFAKFDQNPELAPLLKATGDAYLAEHCPRGRDNFWADNGDGTGRNMLGRMLMDLRGPWFGGTGRVAAPVNYVQTLQNVGFKNSKGPMAAAGRVQAAANMCIQCHVRPKRVKAGGGGGGRVVYHDYCGNNCKEVARKAGAVVLKCIRCHKKDRSTDPISGKVHPYCTKYCAGLAAKGR